ncbi:hypothetical protein CLF_103917 [Clonorchis sinensis]|uniref:Uncharacterized protein n=1 Tax=Clonorchis sinensis TaxID=79923 RepID=G7YAM3_CLOSI|nr:hypothetical protein CLF_103917 [Clonorchis sinensis]
MYASRNENPTFFIWDHQVGFERKCTDCQINSLPTKPGSVESSDEWISDKVLIFFTVSTDNRKHGARSSTLKTWSTRARRSASLVYHEPNDVPHARDPVGHQSPQLHQSGKVDFVDEQPDIAGDLRWHPLLSRVTFECLLNTKEKHAINNSEILPWDHRNIIKDQNYIRNTIDVNSTSPAAQQTRLFCYSFGVWLFDSAGNSVFERRIGRTKEPSCFLNATVHRLLDHRVALHHFAFHVSRGPPPTGQQSPKIGIFIRQTIRRSGRSPLAIKRRKPDLPCYYTDFGNRVTDVIGVPDPFGCGLTRIITPEQEDDRSNESARASNAQLPTSPPQIIGGRNCGSYNHCTTSTRFLTADDDDDVALVSDVIFQLILKDVRKTLMRS